MQMKRFTLLKTALISAVVVAIASLAVVDAAQADPGNGAIVTRVEGGCYIFTPGFGVIVADGQDVQTPSGNEGFVCTGQVDPGTAPRKAIVINTTCEGFTGTGQGIIRITPNGNVIVNCYILP
jgi:hypothetical protein